MNKNILFAVAAIVIILGLGWWLTKSMAPESASESETSSEVAGEGTEAADGSKDAAVDADISVTAGADVTSVTVRYTSSGFSPKTLSIKKGTSVTFINESGDRMWVGSDEHPSHTGYAGTSKDEHCVDGAPSTSSFDQCAATDSYTFTFTKVGTWDYHNHAAASDKGTVTVTE